MTAMPVMIVVLCLMAIAYRYYSAFLAARVAVLDETNRTPAERLNDGHNYHPTNKWVLFGHHFAAISGAGPLIGPVLAAQFGFLPGLLWIVVGVCLGGAVQDFLVLAASLRRDGKSLAQIAFSDIGKVAGTASMIAILFIIVIALAGLGKVVVKALGGESVTFPANSSLVYEVPAGKHFIDGPLLPMREPGQHLVDGGATLVWNGGKSSMKINEGFVLKTSDDWKYIESPGKVEIQLPPGAVRLVPGSSWGTFTIACTIPIALFVGLYMYRIRKGKVVEASIIGGVLTLAATVAGGWVAQHEVGRAFNLSAMQVTMAMAVYGFVASVLPVWVLLCPRDYLSSFLKIGTIVVLVGGTIIANPKLEAPAINHVFLGGGPTVAGKIFPFLFITIMCGAISGFHALVSSGTTPKMIRKETDARTIGYGAMLIEGLVAVVAMVAAATLPVNNYYAMNTELGALPKWQDKILMVGASGGIEHTGTGDAPAKTVEDYERLTQESLRGRTGGAVTLAVGMAEIFDHAVARFGSGAQSTLESLWKYWYHFAIMFEALFILTTIDTGTRIGRFLLQEALGKIVPKLGDVAWLPGSIGTTLAIVAGWTYIISSKSFPFATIWAMFGVANQMLAVIALTIVSAWLVNEGRAKYLWVTGGPLIVVFTTTSTAAMIMLQGQMSQVMNQIGQGSANWNGKLLFDSALQAFLLVAMMVCTMVIIIAGAVRCMKASKLPAVAAGV